MEFFKIFLDSILNFYTMYKVEIFFGIAFILGFILILNGQSNMTPYEALNDFKFNPEAYEVKGYYSSGDNYYIDLYHLSGDALYSCPITKESYDFLIENNGVIVDEIPVS